MYERSFRTSGILGQNGSFIAAGVLHDSQSSEAPLGVRGLRLQNAGQVPLQFRLSEVSLACSRCVVRGGIAGRRVRHVEMHPHAWLQAKARGFLVVLQDRLSVLRRSDDSGWVDDLRQLAVKKGLRGK